MSSRCQFHQHLHAHFSYERQFGSFFLSMYVPMYVKKAAEMTFAQKSTCAFNVDEIDTSLAELVSLTKLCPTLAKYTEVMPNFHDLLAMAFANKFRVKYWRKNLLERC